VKGPAVSSETSVGEAFVKLRGAKVPALIVTGRAEKPIGIVSDADLRLAALDMHGLDAPVASVLPKRLPKVAASLSDAKIRKLHIESRRRSLPMADGAKASSLSFLEGFPKGLPRPSAVIMAGGRGQRLRPLTDKVPKPLLKIGATTIIERIILAIAAAGIEDVFISVNYKAGAFEKKIGDGSRLGVNVTYLREEVKLGTAGSLSLLPSAPSGPVLVTNADILTRLNFGRLLDYHWQRGASATVAAVGHAAQIPYGVMRTDGSALIGVEEKPEVHVLCNAGIYVLEPRALKEVPSDAFIDMPDLLSALVRKGKGVEVFPIVEKWFDIGSPEDFQKVLIEFATGEEE